MYIYIYIYIYGIGVKSGPHGAAASATCQGKKDKMKIIFKLYKSMLLQPLMKKLEVLAMTNQWTTYGINDNNDEKWMIVLIDFYLTFFAKINKSCLIKC